MKRLFGVLFGMCVASKVLALEPIKVEFAQTMGNSVLLFTDSPVAPLLTIEQTASGMTVEMVSASDELVTVEHLKLTGALEDRPYLTGWAGSIAAQSVQGVLTSPADPSSYVDEVPTRMLLQFVVEQASDTKTADEVVELRPLSIGEGDAKAIGEILSPRLAPKQSPSSPAGLAQRPQSGPGAPSARLPHLVTVCGCNPSSGYPQTSCAVWSPCAAACPSVPGTSCAWYIFWVWSVPST